MHASRNRNYSDTCSSHILSAICIRMKDATDFVQLVVAQLADSIPKITDAKDEDGVVINVAVKGNIANVIGKEGKTIEAIRTIAKAIGCEGNHRVKVRINEQTAKN